MLSGPGGWKRVLYILFALTLASAGWAQEAYSRRIWQAADGLPSDVVQAFAETPDHALWIGTANGLVRFDGSRFRYYQRENTSALGADSVFCLTVTRDGKPWLPVMGEFHFSRYPEAGWEEEILKMKAGECRSYPPTSSGIMLRR